jgi:hypothetical protein
MNVRPTFEFGSRLNSVWFKYYVIPQWNLFLALKDSSDESKYEPTGQLANIWNSVGTEIDSEHDLPGGYWNPDPNN